MSSTLSTRLATTDWSELLWFKSNIGKFVVTWFTIKNGLKTREFLASQITIPDLSCVFCNHQLDDCTHLFIECPFAAKIWGRITLKLGVLPHIGSSIFEHMQLFYDMCDHSTEGSIVLVKAMLS